MTRLETLYSMSMKQLVVEAEKIGVKVNKKGKNSVAAEKIYAEEQRRGLELYKEEPAEEVAHLTITGEEPMVDCSALQEELDSQSVVEEPETPVAAAEKKERKPRTKKENPARDQFRTDSIAAVEGAGYQVKIWDKIPNLFAVKNGKHTVAEIRLGLKGWTLNSSVDVAEVISAHYHKQNYFLPATCKFTYDQMDMFIDFINAIA